MLWHSSSHTISDLRDWDNANRLEINPPFQRAGVWSEDAKIMLMDSILQNIPMPKIFFQAIIKDDSTHRIVIDGQQRIKAILSFLKGEFELTEPLCADYIGKKFGDLPKEVRHKFLSYSIDANEILDATEPMVREIYSRVNKYTVVLNKQELRRADFPGDFLDLSERLAVNKYFDDTKVFTVGNRRRLGDIEYTSELLAILISGVQDKKSNLDNFYKSYSSWLESNMLEIEKRFLNILKDLEILLEGDSISKTRYKQKADFYSIFAAINELHIDGFSLEGKDVSNLQVDLKILDTYIAPESNVDLLSEYAIKCVSQGNSFTSRQWRKNFLKTFLSGTYVSNPPKRATSLMYHKILTDIFEVQGTFPNLKECAVCKQPIEDFSIDDTFLTWQLNLTNYQLSNAIFVHYPCMKESQKNYHLFSEDQSHD